MAVAFTNTKTQSMESFRSVCTLGAKGHGFFPGCFLAPSPRASPILTDGVPLNCLRVAEWNTTQNSEQVCLETLGWCRKNIWQK